MTVDEETALIEVAHKMSLSKDPQMASKGRFAKAVAVPFIHWLQAEECRISSGDTGKRIVIAATLAQGIANMLCDFTAGHIENEHWDSFVRSTCSFVEETTIKQLEHADKLHGLRSA